MKMAVADAAARGADGNVLPIRFMQPPSPYAAIFVKYVFSS